MRLIEVGADGYFLLLVGLVGVVDDSVSSVGVAEGNGCSAIFVLLFFETHVLIIHDIVIPLLIFSFRVTTLAVLLDVCFSYLFILY